MVLRIFYNHIKIIIKLQNDHSELPEIQLNKSLVTKNIDTKTCCRGKEVKGAGLISMHGDLNIGRDTSAVKISPEEPWVLTPHQNPQPRDPVTGREVPIPFGCENQQGLQLSEMEGS